MKIRKIVYPIIMFILGMSIGVLGLLIYQKKLSVPISPLESSEVKELPLNKYSFEKLISRDDEISAIEIGETISEESGYSANYFYYTSLGRRVSGQIDVPIGQAPVEGWPIVVMIRGWVDPEQYVTGVGTKNAAAFFANNGYVTIAPDFLGYGMSDNEPVDTIEARLVKPVQVLDLIASLGNIDNINLNDLQIWGHSNGGQIAISVAEILGKRGVSIPTSLWAPVSKPFPYSILYYTDESEDRGKVLRSIVADFEREYDVDRFSIDRYLNWISSPVQIHQGTADDAVPWQWSEELSDTLAEMDKDVQLYLYSSADHNMRPVWDTVVKRDLQFFENN